MVIAIIAILIGLLVPAVQKVREAAARVTTLGHVDLGDQMVRVADGASKDLGSLIGLLLPAVQLPDGDVDPRLRLELVEVVAQHQAVVGDLLAEIRKRIPGASRTDRAALLESMQAVAELQRGLRLLKGWLDRFAALGALRAGD